MNKTVEDLFRDATFQINQDFELFITLWFYEESYGWKDYKGKMVEGSENYIQV